MNEFWIWFNIGLHHILDLSSIDHILFITLLVLTFPIANWSNLLWLVTAFTVGHSISLALSSFFNLYFNQTHVELLIALSILFTVIYNLVTNTNQQSPRLFLIYFVTACFGLVHGLGFSFQLKSLLGGEESLFLPLLYFNLGIEAGQLLIVLVVVLFSLFLGFAFKSPFKLYKLVLLCLIGIISLKITYERLLDVFAA